MESEEIKIAMLKAHKRIHRGIKIRDVHRKEIDAEGWIHFFDKEDSLICSMTKQNYEALQWKRNV